jgi:isoaspartyl peptidase/L-asparaginase-like protein (Ntn-hydrolase superfamily)
MDTGAVTDLRYINNAISTARMVMRHSLHSSLGGLQATSFAVEMGAKLRNLSTPTSSDMYYAWCARMRADMHACLHQHPLLLLRTSRACSASARLLALEPVLSALHALMLLLGALLHLVHACML